MAEAAKYMFDRDLEAPVTIAEPPEVIVERQLRAEFEQQLEEARDQGRREGEEEARKSLEAKADAALEQLVIKAESILGHLQDECRIIRSEAMQTALAASRCLAGELIEREPMALLEALFRECLEHLGQAPHIAVRVHDSLAERFQEKSAAIAEQHGFRGKIIVLGDPETRSGDCRIEWADGGIARDFESLNAAVVKIVNHHLGDMDTSVPALTAGKQPTEENQTPEYQETPDHNSANIQTGTTTQSIGSGEIK